MSVDKPDMPTWENPYPKDLELLPTEESGEANYLKPDPPKEPLTEKEAFGRVKEMADLNREIAEAQAPKEPQAQPQPDVLACNHCGADWTETGLVAEHERDALAHELEAEREQHKRTMNNKEIWRQRTEMLEKREGKAEQPAESAAKEAADRALEVARDYIADGSKEADVALAEIAAAQQRRHQDVSERAETAERALVVEREAHADCDRGHVEQLQAAEAALEVAKKYLAHASSPMHWLWAEIEAAKNEAVQPEAAAQQGKQE